MPRKRTTYTRTQKLAAVVLARHSSSEQAAKAFDLEERTVQRWEATFEVPDDQWTALEELLLSRASEMSAKGQTQGLVATLTAAGISGRNRHYRQLIARREAQRNKRPEADYESPRR